LTTQIVYTSYMASGQVAELPPTGGGLEVADCPRMTTTSSESPLMKLELRGLAFVLGLALSFGACASAEESTATTQQAASKEDPCFAPKVAFSAWKDVVACEKTNPPLYEASLGASLAAGAKCTQKSSTGCVAISGDDEIFQSPLNPYVACERGTRQEDGDEFIQCCYWEDGIEVVCDFAWVRRIDL
jgi:hypothetical protein